MQLRAKIDADAARVTAGLYRDFVEHGHHIAPATGIRIGANHAAIRDERIAALLGYEDRRRAPGPGLVGQRRQPRVVGGKPFPERAPVERRRKRHGSHNSALGAMDHIYPVRADDAADGARDVVERAVVADRHMQALAHRFRVDGVVARMGFRDLVVDADIKDHVARLQPRDARKPEIHAAQVADGRVAVHARVRDAHGLAGPGQFARQHVGPGLALADIELVRGAAADGQDVDIRRRAVIAAQPVAVAPVDADARALLHLRQIVADFHIARDVEEPEPVAEQPGAEDQLRRRDHGQDQRGVPAEDLQACAHRHPVRTACRRPARADRRSPGRPRRPRRESRAPAPRT
jgi:hypothetical protein